MRYSPARMCEQENPGNASAVSKCLHNFGEPSWLAFAAMGVLLGAAAIGFAVYCCIAKYQERNEALATQRRSGSRSPTPQVSVALLTDQSAVAGRRLEASDAGGSYTVNMSLGA